LFGFCSPNQTTSKFEEIEELHQNEVRKEKWKGTWVLGAALGDMGVRKDFSQGCKSFPEEPVGIFVVLGNFSIFKTKTKRVFYLKISNFKIQEGFGNLFRRPCSGRTCT